MILSKKVFANLEDLAMLSAPKGATMNDSMTVSDIHDRIELVESHMSCTRDDEEWRYLDGLRADLLLMEAVETATLAVDTAPNVDTDDDLPF